MARWSWEADSSPFPKFPDLLKLAGEMRWPLTLGLGFLLGCSAAPPSPAARSTSPPAASAPSPPTPAATRAPGSLSKSFTGSDAPSLLVENGFPIAQHVFIDWQPRGTLAPGGVLSLELTAGTHTVTCSDSPDVDDNPVAITEAFESGFGYRYRVAPNR